MNSTLQSAIGPKEGELLLGRYHIEQFLGNGPFASVFRAADLELQSTVVAIKRLHPHLTVWEPVQLALRSRVLEMRQLVHPNILKTFDLEDDQNGQFYIISEYCDGWSLGDLLKQRSHRPLRLETGLYLLTTILSALRYAHEKELLHTNLKPSNILIDRAGEIRVCDFSLNRAFEEADSFTATGEVVASPLYMAPEQFSQKELSPKTDLYSWAVLAYQILCGAPPLQASDYLHCARTHIGGELPTLFQQDTLPLWLAETLERCCAPEPQQRPISVASVQDQFSKHSSSDLGSQHLRDSLAPANARKSYRFRLMLINCVLILLTSSGLALSQPNSRKALTAHYLRLEDALDLNLTWLKKPLGINYSLQEPSGLLRAYRTDCCFDLDFLLLAGIDPGALDEHGTTALHKLLADDPYGLALRVPYLKDPDIPDVFGNTLLHHAVLQNETRLIETLLKHGASPDIPNSQGITPIHTALVYQRPETLEILLRYSKWPDRRTHGGETPLMLALYYFHSEESLLETLRLLLPHINTIQAFNNSGRSIDFYLERAGFDSVKQLLQAELEQRRKKQSQKSNPNGS